MRSADLSARPIAELGCVTARLHGVKEPDTGWFNQYELIQRKADINKLFPQAVAEFYVELHDKKEVPSWVDELTDISKMKLAAL